MELIVAFIIIVGSVAVFATIAKGMTEKKKTSNSAFEQEVRISMTQESNLLRRDFIEEDYLEDDIFYEEEFVNIRTGHKLVFRDLIKPIPPTRYEDDFDHLMKPGSNNAAWFNDADDKGYEPEDW